MSEEVFKAIIAAQDQTAATFESIIARLQKVEHAAHAAGHAAHEVEEHGGGFAHFSERVHELGEHFEGLREHIKGALEKAVELLPALGALSGIGSLVGLFEMTEKAAEGFAEFNAQALKLGITRGQLSGLRLAAQMTDVPIEKLDAGLAKLSLTMGQVAVGKNKDAAGLMRHLGISMRDAHGHARTVADVMPQLADAFKHTTDATMRSRMAAALFGARLGKDLLPMLLEGSEGLDEFSKQAAELKYAVTPEDAEGLEAYHRSMIGLQTAVGGFATELGARLAPVLRPIVDATTDWVVANRDWITQDIASAVKQLSDNLAAVDWAGWATEAHRIGDAMVFLHDKIGDVGTILLATAAIAWANPWLAAIGALILAAQEIYNHWGPISDFFKDLWKGIGDAFDAGWAKIKPVVDALKAAVDWVQHSWAGREIGLAAPTEGGPSLAERASTYIHDHTQPRTLPGPRASSERHDVDEGENRHLVTNWMHDTFVRPGDGGADAQDAAFRAGLGGRPDAGAQPDYMAALRSALMPPPPTVFPAPISLDNGGLGNGGLGDLPGFGTALSVPSGALSPASAPIAAPPQEVHLRVQFDNAPPGTTVDVTRAPDGPPPQIDVGHAMPGIGFAH
jgi:hypothetical protein